MFPALCSLVQCLLEDESLQSSFNNARGFTAIGAVVEEQSHQLHNSDLAQESVKAGTDIFAFAANVDTLRVEVLGEGIIPIVLSLLNVTRIESIITNALRFISLMSIEPFAQSELIDSRDIDSLHSLMEQGEAYPQMSKAASKCYSQLGGM